MSGIFTIAAPHGELSGRREKRIKKKRRREGAGAGLKLLSLEESHLANCRRRQGVSTVFAPD